MLEVNRFYCQDRSFGLYLVATPTKRITHGSAEDLFALEMVEVLVATGLLPPKPQAEFYCRELVQWMQLRSQAIVRYMIPQHHVGTLGSTDDDLIDSSMRGAILVNFRYLACIDGVFPKCQQDELFNLVWHIEDCIRRYSRSMDKFLDEKGMKFTRYLEDGSQQTEFRPPLACAAEYLRVIHSTSLQNSMTDSREIGIYRLRNKEASGFVKEMELAKEMGISQPKLRESLVKTGFLKPVQTGLKTSYEPTKKGYGYCDTAKGRMWHRSVVQLLTHEG